MKPDFELLEALRRKHLVFTVTSGRSGSHFLARVMGYVPGLAVFHEEREHSFHQVLRGAQTDRAVAERFLVEEKLPFIARQEGEAYFEASHLFCKGFFEPMMEWGIVPDLILLTREINKVAASLYQLGTIPGRSEKALTFYLSPDDPTVMPVGKWGGWSDYQCCVWYCLEIQRRAVSYGRQAREAGSRVVRIDLDELKRWDCYRLMLEELALPLPSFINRLKFWKNAERKAGDFSQAKKTRDLPANFEAQAHAIRSLFDVDLIDFEAHGI